MESTHAGIVARPNKPCGFESRSLRQPFSSVTPPKDWVCQRGLETATRLSGRPLVSMGQRVRRLSDMRLGRGGH